MPAYLRCDLAAAIGIAAERVGSLCPVWAGAAWPKVLADDRGSALHIELGDMQAVGECSCHVMRRACDWVSKARLGVAVNPGNVPAFDLFTFPKVCEG